MENWREELNTILEGIDEEETHNEKGWWETSLGAEFGREVKVLIIKLIEQELDKAREEGKKEYLKEVELMQRFSSRKEVDLTRDEAFKRLVRLLKSKLKDNK